MTFIESPRFPTDIRFGSLSGPTMSTDIVSTGGGVEHRNANWDLPLYRFQAGYAVKTRAVALQVYELFLAMQGRFGGFRVQDAWDYSSASDGVGTPLATDHIIGTGNAVEVDFQLVKIYTKGGVSLSRKIKKPVASKGVLIEVDGSPLTEGVGYTVDYTTGIVTFTGAPLNTHVITAGYEFDVPCRFDTDDLSHLQFQISNTSGDGDIVSFADIPLVEDRLA